MSNPRSARTSRVLVAVGVVSSLCALAASYLYLVSPDTTLSSSARPTRRRQILVSAATSQDFLTHIPESAMLADDLFFCFFQPEFEEAELESRCTHVLRHEKQEGLTHIARHMAPDILLVLPSMAGSVKLADVKDWVGRVVVVHDAPLERLDDVGNTSQVKHISSQIPYAQFFAQT